MEYLLQAILRDAERFARRPGAHPMLLAEICAISVEHEARRGDLGAARAYFREGMQLASAQEGWIDGIVPKLHHAWGTALLNQGLARDALGHFQEALTLWTRRFGEAGYPTRFARAGVSAARFAMGDRTVLGDDRAALAAARAASPRRARLLESTAWIVARRPEHDAATVAEACAAARQALEIMPDTWLVTRTLAIAQLRAGDHRHAIETARLTRERLQGDRPELWAIEAMAAAALGDRTEARRAVGRAIALLDEPEFAFDHDARELVDEAIAATR